MELGPYLILGLLEGLVTAAVLALMALGLSLVFGVMRVVNVAHGEFFMIGAVLAWWIADAVGSHPAFAFPAAGFMAAILIAPVLTAMLAMAADQLVLKRLDYDPERTIVATIGLLYIIQQVTLMRFGPDARPVEAPFNHRLPIPFVEWQAGGLQAGGLQAGGLQDGGWQLYWPWGLGTTSYKLFVIMAAAVLITLIWLVLTRTRAGLVMRATRIDRDMAQAFGIPVGRVYAAVFGLGAGLAALAGVLIVPIQQAHYLMGHDPLLLSFIVVIIGGLGSLPGTVVAALLIGVGDGLISVFFSPTLAKIIATLGVAFVLIFRPEGLFGGRRQ